MNRAERRNRTVKWEVARTWESIVRKHRGFIDSLLATNGEFQRGTRNLSWPTILLFLGRFPEWSTVKPSRYGEKYGVITPWVLRHVRHVYFFELRVPRRTISDSRDEDKLIKYFHNCRCNRSLNSYYRSVKNLTADISFQCERAHVLRFELLV